MSGKKDRWEFYQDGEGKWHCKVFKRKTGNHDPFAPGYETHYQPFERGFDTREECEEYATRFGYKD